MADIIRKKQVQFFQQLLSNVQNNCVTFEGHGIDQQFLQQPLSILVSSSCSCGRFFEQHPTIIEDTEGAALENFLQTLGQGFCRCLKSNQSYDDPSCQLASKTWLHVAAALGSLELLKHLAVWTKIDVNAVSSLFNFTCLSLAVMHTNVEVLSWLCAHPEIKVNIKAKSEQHTPLVEAMLAEKYHLVDILCRAPGIDLNSRNFRQETPLIIAVRMNNARLVRQLLAVGADHSVPTGNGVLPFFLAVRCSRQVLQEFIAAKVPIDQEVNQDGDTPFYAAVREGLLTSVQTLHEAGADTHFKPGCPALVLAASMGHWKVAAYLLDSGEDPNQQDGQGWSTLHYACRQGSAAVVYLLLMCGAEVDCLSTSLSSPLSVAVFCRHLEVAKLLMSRNCQINTPDTDLDTPLHFAAFYGDVDLVTLLLEHGAETNIFNRAMSSPLFNACLSGRTDLTRLLLPYYTDKQIHVRSYGFSYDSFQSKSRPLYPFPRSILWVASSTLNFDMVSLLLFAGYDASTETWIHDKDFPFDLDSEKALALADVLRLNASMPRTLLSLTRIAVRCALKPGKQRLVHQLGLIPRKIKNYILLRDVDNFFT